MAFCCWEYEICMCTVNYNNHDITVKVTFFLYHLVQDVSDTLGIQNSISYILST